jgi:hypothetical protein
MPGLTAKVFRTYNASYTMARLLNNLENDPRSRGTIHDKVKLYNDCNREVAILCNHKRAVNASHEQQMQKLGDRVSDINCCRSHRHVCIANTLVTDQGLEISEMEDKANDPGY